MTVRIICDYCSGELQIPSESAAKKIRCPLCGKIFVSSKSVAVFEKDRAPRATADTLRDGPLVNTTKASPSRGLSAAQHAPLPDADASTPWSPINEEDLDSSVPWYVLVGALAPAGLLAFVEPELIAIGVATVLVGIALFVATRRNWSRISRFTGVISLALLGIMAAAAVNLYADGNFANLASKFSTSPADGPGIGDLGDVTWAEYLPPDTNASILFPGPVAKGMLGEPKTGTDIFVYQTRFPKQAIIFTLHTFKIPLPTVAETSEIVGLQKMDAIVPWIFYEGVGDPPKKAYFREHPGLEYHFSVLARKTKMLCRAYLVRDRAYLVSVSADNLEAVRPLADMFLSSFRLTTPTPAMRTPPRDPEPDWKALGRTPIPRVKPLASFRGHFRPPIVALSFSADGKSLVSGTSREHLLLWDIATGFGSTIANTQDIPFFALAPNGKSLVVPLPKVAGISSDDMHFLPLEEPVPPQGPANTDFIAFPPDDRTAIVALDTMINAWEGIESKKAWHRSASDSPIACLALTRDGRLLATAGSVEGTIRLWDTTRKGVDHANWRAHGESKRPAPIQQLAFAPDGKTLASAGIDSTVKLWNVADPDRPKLVANMMHEEPLSTVEYSNDGALLATGDATGVIRLWEAATGKLLHEFRASQASQSIHLMRFSPDDTKLAAAVEMGIGRAGVNLFEIKTLPPAAGGLSVSFPQTDEPPLFKDK